MARFRNIQPPSLRILVAFGFALAIIPLLIGLFSAIYSIDRLTKISRITVHRAVRVTLESRILLEKLTDMERSARQYLVLEDPLFWDAYEKSHDEFVLLVHNLMNMVGQDQLWRLMKLLAAEEIELFRGMSTSELDSGRLDKVSARFKYLNSLVHELGDKGAALVRKEVRQLGNSYDDLKKRILAQLSVLLPISIFLIIVFVYLIIRPIRQLDRAIRGLGGGDFDSSIRISGTQDFEYLGGRLNWLRQRLKQLEQDKRKFLRNVSHELKTPLATINEGVGLLVDEVVGELNAEQKDIVNILYSSSTKLERLIEGLLKFSQLQSDAGDFTREQVDLSALVNSVIREYQISLRAKEIVLRLQVQPVNIFGMADKFRIILENLLSNAVKYSPRGGEIRVSLYRSGGQCYLDIEDDGPGIDPDERKKVFDLFYQGRATREAGIKGSGVGLAIVAECVAVHNGKIEALEPSPGKSGALFRISMPFELRQNYR